MYRQIKRMLAMGSILLFTCASLASAGDAGLVSMLTSQLGVTQTQAEGGAGAIFNLAKQNMSPADYLKVSASVPEATSLLDKAPLVGATVGAVQGKEAGVTESVTDKAMGAVASAGLPGMEKKDVEVPVKTDDVVEKATETVTEAVTPKAESSGLTGALGLPGAEKKDAEVPVTTDGLVEKATETVTEAATPKAESGGLTGALGSVASMAGGSSSSGLGSLGGAVGKLGALGSLGSSFSKLGMSSDMVGKFAPIVLDYAKSKGGDMVSDLLIKSLM